VDRLEKNWAALNNYGGWATLLNAPANRLAQMRGDPRIARFEQDQKAVADELMRVWRQTGPGSEKEIESWKAGLALNASPESQQATIQEIYHLISGKLAALKSQYESGMGRPMNFHMLIQPDTLQRFHNHGVDASDLAPGSTYANIPTAAAPAVTPAAAAHPPQTYKGATYVWDDKTSQYVRQ
jgi:hypothetical protein